jgi:hypothetical protein
MDGATPHWVKHSGAEAPSPSGGTKKTPGLIGHLWRAGLGLGVGWLQKKVLTSAIKK